MARVLPFLMLAPVMAYGQGAPPPAAPPPVDASQQVPTYNQQQLDQMLAPIALYPDQLLTQILMAATFPLEIVEAYRWIQDPNNGRLRGDQLVAALQPLPWDPSVKSLVPFPQILKMLNDNLDWTQALGTAFANQQADAMNEVQHLRQEARAAGKLQSTPQMVVQDQGPAIAIQPADPQTVYVPVYDPTVVYGGWPYPAYPPVYLPPPPDFVGIGYGVGIGVGIGFSVGFGVGAFGPLWGWASPAWGAGSVNVNVNQVTNITNINNVRNRYAGGTWHHPTGPGGGPYRPAMAGGRGGGPAAFHPPGPGGHGPGPGGHGPGPGGHGPGPGGHGPGPGGRGLAAGPAHGAGAGHGAGGHGPSGHGAVAPGHGGPGHGGPGHGGPGGGAFRGHGAPGGGGGGHGPGGGGGHPNFRAAGGGHPGGGGRPMGGGGHPGGGGGHPGGGHPAGGHPAAGGGGHPGKHP